MDKDTAIDVALVGAGPVGLFLARELTRHGHRVRLFEQRAQQSEHSKALAIMPRTMEIFELAGTVAPFEVAANRVTAASIVSHQHELGTIPFAPQESHYRYVAMVPQDVTERILLDALLAAGGRVEYETTLVDLERREDGATLVLRGAAGEERCEARYVVGCDGAHSSVRHLLDFPFEGAEYQQTFVLIDAETTGDDRANVMQLCPHELGPIAVFPMSARRRRLVAAVAPDFKGEPTLELANALLAERGPKGLRAESLVWASTFRVQHRQTPSMRIGCVFLAGDASHIHSPFGAQGMNTGLQDAWNLSWKLDYVLKGWGTDTLLESYSLERHAIAKRVIAVTDALTRAMSTPSAIAQAARNVAIPLLTRFEPFRHLFVSNLSELGISLAGSPIVAGAGRRAPDDLVRTTAGEARTYEVLAGRYLVICPAGADALTKAARALATEFSDAVRVCIAASADERDLRLVRPDAYVAFENAGGRGESAIADLRRLLATHLASNPGAATTA